jgi:WD40 repeat protein
MLLLQGHRRHVHSLAFSPDGTTLASVEARSSHIWFWDLAHGKVTAHAEHTHRISSIAYSPLPPTTLAWSDSAGNILVWQTDQRHSRQIDRVEVPPDVPVRLAFGSDGRTLAANATKTGAGELWGAATLWRLGEDGTPSKHFASSWYSRFSIYAITLSPDLQLLALGGLRRQVTLWDVNSEESLVGLWHARKVHFLTFCHEGKTLVSGSPDGLVQRWDVATGKKLGNLKGQGKGLLSLAASPDGRLLATGTSDGRVQFWDAATGRPRAAFDWQIGAIHSLAFAPDGMRAATGGDGSIVVWDIDDV